MSRSFPDLLDTSFASVLASLYRAWAKVCIGMQWVSCRGRPQVYSQLGPLPTETKSLLIDISKERLGTNAGGAAQGTYEDGSDTVSNFGQLHITTTAGLPDNEQMRAAGYLEGWLTAGVEPWAGR